MLLVFLALAVTLTALTITG